MNSTSITNIKTLYNRNPWKGRFALGLFVIVTLLGIARLSMPQVIIYSATSWLEKQGVDATIESININLFDGSISLLNTKTKKNEDQLLTIGEISFDWHWSPLSEKNIVITSVAVDNLSVDIQQYSETLIIAGIHFPINSTINDTTDKSNDNIDTIENSWAASLNNLSFTNLSVCYENINDQYSQASSKPPEIHYCTSLDKISWQGKVHYSTDYKDLITINGDLTLINTTVNNKILLRELVSIKSLAMKNLKLDDFNTVSLGSLTIDGLSALQRSKDKTDTSLSFSHLAINSTSYKNNIASIDTITLNDLSSNVSKNKNGDWEHKKWNSDSHTKTTSPSAKKADNNEPTNVSLNSLTINSQKEISYTDNSTEPATSIGLQELEFSITELSSNNPNNDSTFTLAAKTKHHSTINLAGTTRPFANNVSVDAEGKLKGFDLRVGTAEAKKAIGHIIKSGQLDADLKILAEEGQLNSEVKLSLYQFHIKPVSKTDAVKLDKTLGMPLNQTLILLRDKDDSIHLDIPITGDINSPDFNPMSAIVKATTKAATVTLITFYTPYGLIFAGGNALFDFATALNLDPIIYTSGSLELTTDGKEQLDKLIVLLTEKPQIHLTLCGTTNANDADKMFPELKKASLNDKKENLLTKDQISLLNKLATNRQIASKNYLINTNKITHDRLILCEPEHLNDENIYSGVEINI